jgi:hypothetical protein
MAGIFISYRRDDAGGWARSVSERLHKDLPGVPIFMDVDAIGPGEKWREEIRKALEAADVFLAVLDRDFARADSRGQRRLDEANDPVRHELAAALKREDITVFPVLVGGATMPAAEELPADVAEITEHNALTLSNTDWEAGIVRLVGAVRGKLRAPPPPPPRPRPGEDEGTGVQMKAEPAALLVGLGGAALLVLATAVRWDVLVDPFRGGGDVPYLGAVVAPASIIVPVGALYALLKAWGSSAGPLATGLLLGFAVGGVAKYASLLGQQDPDHLGSSGSLLLGLAGAAVLAGVATFWLVTRYHERGRPAQLSVRVFAAAGAVLIAAATFVPFNNSFSNGSWKLQVISTRSTWEAFEPLAVAAVIVLAVVFAGTTNRLVLSGLFVALGLVGAFYWLRYIGVPVLQMLQEENLASVRPGGFIGLAGSALLWVAGIAGRGRAATYARAGR